MNEKILSFVWAYKLFNFLHLTTTNRKSVEIVHSGTLNLGSGPDFFNAAVRIDGVLWHGTIELHVRSKDWYLHGHNKDAAYNGVILHVVYELNTHEPLFNALDREVPTICLADYMNPQLLPEYQKIMENKEPIPCGILLTNASNDIKTKQLTQQLHNRLEQKSAVINAEFMSSDGHWQESFYRILLRSFGFGQNQDAYLRLARSLPFRILLKHAGNIEQLEALLLGTAGFLQEQATDAYSQKMNQEYAFLSKKYQLQPLSRSVWKLKMRPYNLPSIRLAQFASLMNTKPSFLQEMLNIDTLNDLYVLLKVNASAYWDRHYSLGNTASVEEVKYIGADAAQSLIINAVLPFLFFYGGYYGQKDLELRVLKFYRELPAEKNHITKLYNTYGWKVKNAGESQGLIQLKTTYCDAKRCLECSVGQELLKGKA